MSNFQKKLYSYINKNLKDGIEFAPHFKYGETTYISPEVAYDLYILYKTKFNLEELLNKEQDYNRLLRQENDNLECYISDLESSTFIEGDIDDEKENNPNKDEKLPLS